MSDRFRRQLYRQLNQRDTEELLAIWQENNRGDWSDAAFEVMQEILQERLGEVPPQNAPTFERTEPDEPDEPEPLDLVFQQVESEEEPVFYRPKEALWIVKWLKRLSVWAVVATIVVGISMLSSTYAVVAGFFEPDKEPEAFVWFLTFLVVVFGVALQSAIYYFGFRWLAFALEMLMEMEFRSRKVL